MPKYKKPLTEEELKGLVQEPAKGQIVQISDYEMFWAIKCCCIVWCNSRLQKVIVNRLCDHKAAFCPKRDSYSKPRLGMLEARMCHVLHIAGFCSK